MNTSPNADLLEPQNGPRSVGQVDNILGLMVSVSAALLVLADIVVLFAGVVDTDLLVGKIDDVGKRRVAEGVPLGRLASAQDIANACLFLASDQSAYITGIVLDVSGGLHIH